MEIKLKVVQCPPESDMSGHLINVDESGATIGRAATNTLALPDPNRYVSSLHAKIQFNGQHFEIVDQSTNGTFLNNLSQALVKGQPRAVAHRDQILMGPFVLEVEVVGAENKEVGGDSTSITNELDDTTSLTIPPNDAGVGIDDLDKWLEPDARKPEPLPKLTPASSVGEDSIISPQEKELDPLAALGKDSSKNDRLDLNFGIGGGDWNAAEGEPPNAGELGGQRMDIPGMIPTDWDKSMVVPAARTPLSEKTPQEPGKPLPDPFELDPILPESGSSGGRGDSLLDLVNTPPEQLKSGGSSGGGLAADSLKIPLDETSFGLESGLVDKEQKPQKVSLSEKPKLPFDPSDSLVDKELSDLMDLPIPEPLPKMRDEHQIEPEMSAEAKKPADAEGKIVTNKPGNEFFDPFAKTPETGELVISKSPVGKPDQEIAGGIKQIPKKPVAKRRTTGQLKVPSAAPGADSLIDFFGEQPVGSGSRPETPPARPESPKVTSAPPEPITVKATTAADSSLARNLAEAMGLVGLTDEQLAHLVPIVAKFVVVTVDGLMGALRARQTIKNEFRMNLTMIQAVENNPLKFSLSTEDAIENLFVKSRKAYLSATEAADEAFADIADHQLALFNGIRAAYDELMGQFSPERLEKRFERQRGKSLFGGSGKKWEAYQNFIEELNEDQERTFKHLFGEVFAEQYERSFEALKAKRRK